MTLSAREIFKKEEHLKGNKTYFKGEEKVIKYGKLDKITAYRIIERVKFIYNNSKFKIEVMRMDSEKDFQYRVFTFDTLTDAESFIINNPTAEYPDK